VLRLATSPIALGPCRLVAVFSEVRDSSTFPFPEFVHAAIENAVESTYPRLCQMNRNHPKNIFLTHLT
jgi:hypothetical protein